MSSRGPVLLFGLDGLGWPVLQPLIEAGKTPFLGYLVQDGASGSMVSPWPGSTFPSWTSIMTGTTPGVHGMLDFAELDPASYRIRFIDSRTRRVPAIWEIASKSGKRCVVLGVPGTYPPDKAVELMISGFDTPVTTSIDPSFIWPPKWRKKLAATVGLFPLTPVQELRIGTGWHRRAWKALQGSIEGKVKVAELALRELKPDLFVIVFGESDTVCHHFWHFADPFSPRAHGADPELSLAIQDIVIRLDRALAFLHKTAGGDATTLVVSDHGFGGAGTEALYINRYLHEEGLLNFKPTLRLTGRAQGSLDLPARLLPRTWQQWAFRQLRGGLIPRIESRRRFRGIDWDTTVSYSEELNYAPSVRINLRGREGCGTVDPESYHDVREHVRETLLRWEDPVRRDRVVRHVWYREELLDGPAVSKAPDLLLDLNTPGGYSYIVLPSAGAAGEPQRTLEGRHLSGAKGAGMNGSHRRDGIIIAQGRRIQNGIDGARVSAEQVAALALYGLELDSPSWLASPPQWGVSLPGRVSPTGAFPTRGEVAEGDRALNWERLRRLRDLGYLG